MWGSILRAITKARKHQSDKKWSVRGEWFTGLEGVSTRSWKINSKAKLSIPSISQLLALTGVTWSNSCTFAPVKERRSKATEQDLSPTTTAAEVRSEGEESISKDRIFTCREEGCVPTFLSSRQCNDTSVRWNETLYSIKQLCGIHRNLKNNVKPILNSCSEQAPSMTDALPQGWVSFRKKIEQNYRQTKEVHGGKIRARGELRKEDWSCFGWLLLTRGEIEFSSAKIFSQPLRLLAFPRDLLLRWRRSYGGVGGYRWFRSPNCLFFLEGG